MGKKAKKNKKSLAEIQKFLNSDIWSAHFSEKHNNTIFYYNKVTKVSTWKHPNESSFKNLPAQTSQSQVLPLASNKRSLPQHETLQKSKLSKPNVQSNPPNKTKTVQKSAIYSAPVTYDDNNNKTLSKSGLQLNFKQLKRTRVTKTQTQKVKSNAKQNILPKPCMPTIISVKKNSSDHKFLVKTSIANNKKEIKQTNLNADYTSDNVNSLSKQDFYRINPLSQMEKPALVINSSTKFTKTKITAKTEADVEMLDISVIEDKQTVPTSNAFIFVVVDTNVLLKPGGLKDIDTIVDWFPLPPGHFRRVIIVIPWIVLQELDGLKNSNIAKKARGAVTFLNNHFISKKPGIRGQTIMEAAFVIDGLDIEVNDDRLLQCCFFFRQLPGKHVTVLFSKDNNLCNKAMVNNFRTFSEITNLVKGLTNLCCGDSPKLDTQENQFTSTPNGEVIQDAGYSSLHIDNTEDVIEEDERSEEIFSQVSEILLKTLSFILTREMVEAYGKELWQDIVIIKPPWTLTDVLHCIKKHWLAVFVMIGVDKLSQNLLTEIIDYVKLNAHKILLNNNEQSLKEEKDFIYKSIQFVKGLCKGQKYSQNIKTNIQTLQRIHRNYGKHKNLAKPNIAVKEAIISKQNNLSDEAIKAQIETFWTVLDQVWMSIIKHCIAIFTTLQFTPSQTREIPLELTQGENNVEFNPTPEMCVSVLPLLIQLIESLLQAIQRFSSTYSSLGASPNEGESLDFLQTLWTTTQAFSLHTNVESINPSYLYHCTSTDDISKLNNGGEKLNSVYLILQECRSFLSHNFG